MPGAARVFLQVETDSGRVGWQPQPWRTYEEQCRSYLLESRPILARLQGSGVGVPSPICTLSSCAPQGHIPLGSPGHWARFRGQGPPSLVNDLSAQVFRTCRDGFRRRQRGTIWSGARHQLPAPRLSPALAAAAPRLLLAAAPARAEHTLGLCHEAVGNFATVSRRVEQEEGASPPPAPFSVSFTTAHEAMEKLSESQQLP